MRSEQSSQRGDRFIKWRRWCPACLKSEPIFKEAWTDSFADACIQHKTWLIDQCPRCSLPLSWREGTLLTCSCGALIAESVTHDAPEAVIRMTSAILRQKLLDAKQRSPWRALGQSSLQRVVRFLGSYASAQLEAWPQKTTCIDRLSVSWRITTAAAEVLDAWPNGFHWLLDRLTKRPGVADSRRLPTVLGQFYRQLYGALSEPEFEFLRQELQAYIALHWKGALSPCNKRLSKETLTQRQWIPWGPAGRSLSVSRRRLHKVLDGQSGLVVSRSSATGRVFRVVHREHLERCRIDLQNSLTLLNVAQKLGLCRRRARALARYLFPDAGQQGACGTPWNLPKRKVEHLLAQVESLPSLTTLSEDQVDFRTVLKHWKWTDTELGQLLHKWMSQELVAVGRQPDLEGLGALVFPRDELHSLHTQVRRQSAGLTAPELAKELGLKQEVVYHLIRRGTIVTSNLRTNRRGAYVAHAEAKRFSERYVFCRELAKELDTSSTKVEAMLHDQGVTPVSGPSVDGCRQLLYLRTEVAKAHLGMIHRASRGSRTGRASRGMR